MVESVEWNSKFAFFMAAIGAAVGLGNIWRFPYLFYTCGQGTFIIPYIIAILIVGLPFMLFEFAIGAKFKRPVIKIYESISKKVKTVAWITLGIMSLLSIYYTVIISWSFDYFLLSFTNGWGSNPDFFFNNVFLQYTSSISGLFQIVPFIFFGIIVIWVLMWIILSRDINEGIGKFSTIFVPLLLVLSIGLVIYEVLLPGASIGYMMFFKPDLTALGDLNIWLAAFSQVVFTLSLGYTLSISYASHLPKNSRLPSLSSTIILANCGFEIVNAIGIFSILGFMSYSSGVPFDSLITQGTGLVFVALPTVFNILGPVGKVIGPLFFFSLVVVGISSCIGAIEPTIDSTSLEFNMSRRKVMTIFTIVSILISVIFASRIGNLLIVNIDFLLNNILIIGLVVSQCIIFAYIYNIDKLINFINKDSLFDVYLIKFFVKYIIPIVLSILILFGIYELLITLDIISLLIYIVGLLFIVIFTLLFRYLSNKKENSN